MESYNDILADQIVVQFGPEDRLACRFTEGEWAGLPRLRINHECVLGALSGCYTGRILEVIENHIDAYERRVLCFRPGGWDANGAPV